MSQNDLVIANQSFPTFRADLNNALQALGSLNSGSSTPTTTYANMLWYDTSANILKMRSEADDLWINVGYVDQAGSVFSILDNTKVVDSSGNQVGLLGDQATTTWEAGTGTTESLVSPAKVKAAAEAAIALGNFTSGEIVYTNGGLNTTAHGFAATPKSLTLHAICKIADAGFSVGDTVSVGSPWSSGSNNYNMTVWADTTNIYIRTATLGHRHLDPTGSGGFGAVTTANRWRLIVRASA
mgnify:CR=1 FL=1